MPEPPETLLVEVEKSGPCSRVLHIRVPASRVEKEIEDVYRSVARSVQFPGFRAGKVPRRLIEARLGEQILEDVKRRLVESALEEAVEAKEVRPVGQGRIKEAEKLHVARGADLAFDVEFDVRPEFQLPKLDEITVKRPRTEVADSDVDAEIDRLREERATVEDAGDEPLAENGIAVLDVLMRAADEILADESAVEWQHPSPVLNGLLVEGLAEGLLGKRRGDVVEFRATLPNDFHEERLRGQQAAIQVTVEAVRRVRLPAVDDAFAAEMDYDSLEEMRADVRRQVETRLEAQTRRALDEAIVDALVAAVPLDLPPTLVEAESERLVRRFEAQLRQDGVAEDAIPARIAEVRNWAEGRVRRSLAAGFLLDRIASERKVFATETEVRQEVAAMAARYNRSVSEMEDYAERNGLLPALRQDIRERKTLRELSGVVRIVEA